MLRFSHSWCDGFRDYVVAKSRFTEDKAINIAKEEFLDVYGKGQTLALYEAYVTRKTKPTVNGDAEEQWWLENDKRPFRNIPVWVIRKYDKSINTGLKFTKIIGEASQDLPQR